MREANYQYGHDNDASDIREHQEITFHKTLKKVHVPENDEILDKFHNHRRYL